MLRYLCERSIVERTHTTCLPQVPTMKRFSLSSMYVSNQPMHPARLRGKVLTVAATVGVAAGGVAMLVQGRQRDLYECSEKKKLRVNPTVVEAFAGAVGEVAQVAVLYPLDTIKVRCQAAGCSALTVLRELLVGGVNYALMQKLYAGVVGAALCSIAVGAVHYASYESSKRGLLNISTHYSYWHGQLCTPTTEDVEVRNVAKDVTAQGKTFANVTAAALAAIITAVVEAPVELFRHNAQAGLVKANFLKEMVKVTRRSGFRGLYWGFLPHCFEAWPYDISELLVYGNMKDYQETASGNKRSDWVHAIPGDVWDLATGAAAGAAAVLVSMPFDCVKTYMQTHGTDLTGQGIIKSAGLFLATGKQMVANKGWGSLYVGVVPRLLQQVPSAMLCWWSIEAFKRAVEPHVQSS